MTHTPENAIVGKPYTCSLCKVEVPWINREFPQLSCWSPCPMHLAAPDLLAALEALVGWQDKLSLSDRHATADQARAWSLDCRNARAEVAKAKGIKE